MVEAAAQEAAVRDIHTATKEAYCPHMLTRSYICIDNLPCNISIIFYW
jgi:hypothetical protein